MRFRERYEKEGLTVIQLELAENYRSMQNILDAANSVIRNNKTRLADKQLGLEVTDKAKEYIIEHGFDPAFGARPLKRYIQGTVETLIAKKIISADISDDNILRVDADGEGLWVK